MERMRWLPALGSRPNVFVNVALFRMWATDPASGEEPLRMNVVVGQSMNHKTPIFVEHMEYVVFRPYWNPPRGITVKEMVPRARRDPSYLDREELEIVATGDDNAAALPATPENLTAVLAGKLFIRQRPGPRTPWASRSSFSRTPRTSTCTARRRSSCFRASVATSATGASASRSRRVSPRGCSAT